MIAKTSYPPGPESSRYARYSGPLDRVAETLVTLDAFPGHAPERSHGLVEIVIDQHFAFFRMETVQAADVLCERSPPRDGHCEEQRVEAGIVEPLSDIAAGRDQASESGISSKRCMASRRSFVLMPPLRQRTSRSVHRRWRSSAIEPRNRKARVPLCLSVMGAAPQTPLRVRRRRTLRGRRTLQSHGMGRQGT